jgi:putative ATP-dependent endonuclease of the OLD family
MQIVQIAIKNFRCIKDALLFPSKNSVLLGPNNSGKTAILEALNLLLNPELNSRNHSIDENDFYNRCYYTPPTPISIGVAENISAKLHVDGISIGKDDSNIPPTEQKIPNNTNHVNQGIQAVEVPEGIYPVASESILLQTTEADVIHSISRVNGSIEIVTPQESSRKEEPTNADLSSPKIYIEAILTGLTAEDEDLFFKFLIPWNEEKKEVLENSDEEADPFEGKVKAIRIFFEAWYSEEEDDFLFISKFLKEINSLHDECEDLLRNHKRQIGFLIYRDLRGFNRPITLEAATLFGRLMQSQNVIPKNFERVFANLSNTLSPIHTEPDLVSLLNSYKAEIERFMPLSPQETTALSIDLTDRTRKTIKEEAQLYSKDDINLPLQKSGAGTRSLSVLAMLTLIMRRRGRGILALEEPETYLFPHAQRRVIDECLELANQTFITTHSPFVLERIPIEGVGRVQRELSGILTWEPIKIDNYKQSNNYSRRLKDVHCEALMGKGVVIVEGISDRWWLLGASRIMNRKEHNSHHQEAFELQGIAVVSADTNGDILKLGEFFFGAGLKSVGLFDQVDSAGLMKNIYESKLPCLFLWGEGIEEILKDELPVDILIELLTVSPQSSKPLLESTVVRAMCENEIRNLAFEKLKHEKGFVALHEWLINKLDEETLPTSLKQINDIVSQFVSGKIILYTQTICKQISTK